jgi:hypothetical protein
LWKAYTEGLRPSFQSSGITFRPGPNIATKTCTDPAAEAGRIALDHAQALVTIEGGDKAAAMERLIARVQLRAGMDKANVINMLLADFVAALTVGNESQAVPKPAGDSETELKPNKRGRPKADYETVQREAQVAADWGRARDSGVYKPDFAKQIGMTTVKLDALLDRVAARNRRSGE